MALAERVLVPHARVHNHLPKEKMNKEEIWKQWERLGGHATSVAPVWEPNWDPSPEEWAEQWWRGGGVLDPNHLDPRQKRHLQEQMGKGPMSEDFVVFWEMALLAWAVG